MAVIGSTWAVLVGAVILYLSWVFLRTFESNPFWIRVEVLPLLRPSPPEPLLGVSRANLAAVWSHFAPKGHCGARHTILMKEQHIFEEPVMRALAAQTLNPVFSSKHFREIMQALYEVVHRTRHAIVQRVTGSTDDESELGMLSLTSRTTLEVLGQAGIGYPFDPPVEYRPDHFAKAIKDFAPYEVCDFMPATLAPGEHRDAIFPSTRRHYNVVTMHDVGEGRDVRSILLRENMQVSQIDRLPDDELIGQVSMMVTAGMDTIANSLARILQLLAPNPDVRTRLRDDSLCAPSKPRLLAGCSEDLDKMELPFLDALLMPRNPASTEQRLTATLETFVFRE
ncbi:cytochrome P450 [Earliella scabrosa]|nr:cytochrome P450 [Earliella scabrosa]